MQKSWIKFNQKDQNLPNKIIIKQPTKVIKWFQKVYIEVLYQAFLIDFQEWLIKMLLFEKQVCFIPSLS